jgi:hypothetical protein
MLLVRQSQSLNQMQAGPIQLDPLELMLLVH